MIQFSEQQVKSVSPDQKLDTAKNILDLNLWSDLHVSGNALWGKFQGSEKEPYQVTLVSTNNLVTPPQIQWTCTCKSRKQPCKHVLALMLLSADEHNFQPVQDGLEPDFVKKLKGEVKNPEAQAQRLEQRFMTVLEGADFLESWLKDIIRLGLSNSEQDLTQNNVLDDVAKRLGDFQVPNLYFECAELSNSIKSLGVLAVDDHNPLYVKVLSSFTKMFMLCKALRSYDQLPVEWQGELRRLVGFKEKKSDILNQSGVHDAWMVLHYERDSRIDHLSLDTGDNKLLEHTYWLYGLTTNHVVFLKSFEMKTPTSSYKDHIVDTGSTYVGTMYFYPSVGDIKRALFKPDYMSLESFESKGAGKGLDEETALNKLESLKGDGNLVQEKVSENGGCNFEQLLNQRKQYYASNPFAENFLGLVHNVHFAHDMGKDYYDDSVNRWYIVDNQGKALLTDLSNCMFRECYEFVGNNEFSAYIFFKDEFSYLANVDEVALLCVVYNGKFLNLSQHRGYVNSIEHRSVIKQYSAGLMSLLAQAKLGTTHDVLDINLFDEPLRDNFKQIQEQCSSKEEAFFQVASSILAMHKVDVVHTFDSSTLDNLKRDFGADSTNVTTSEDNSPYFSQETIDVISWLKEVKKQILSKDNRTRRGFNGFFNLLDFWTLQQLMSTGKKFSPEQYSHLFLDPSTESSNSLSVASNWYDDWYGFDCSCPVFCSLQRVEMLLHLVSSEDLRLNLPFFIKPNVTQYLEETDCLNFLLSKKGVVEDDGSLNYKLMFELSLNKEDRGNLPQIFAMLRQKDPDLARELFDKNFDELLCYPEDVLWKCASAFNINLSLNDEDFLNILRKKVTSRDIKANVLDMLNKIPQSKHSKKCMKLWKKFVSFNEAMDMWDISEINYSSAFSSLGIAKSDDTLYLLGSLFKGMDWQSLKEVTGSSETKEALRRLTLIPCFTAKGSNEGGLASSLSNKLVYSLAIKDSEIAAQDINLINSGVLPLPLLDASLRMKVIEQAKDVCNYSPNNKDFFSVKLQDGRLSYSLIEDDELLKVLIDGDYSFIVKSMSPQCIPWLKQLIDKYQDKISKGVKVLKVGQLSKKEMLDKIEILEVIVEALTYKQRVLDALDREKLS